MKILRFFLVLVLIVSFSACKDCVQCSFSYTEVKTEMGPNGENTFVDTIKNQQLPDQNGVPKGNVCGKEEDVEVLRTRYENGNNDGQYENYDYNCVEQ